jgi:hypothetical protein
MNVRWRQSCIKREVMAAMKKVNNDLPIEEVKRIVYSYGDARVTDELYSFGSVLLTEIRNRAGNIDSKAATMLGWSTGILVFLFTQIDKHSGGFIALAFAVASGLCCLLSAIYAFLALRARNEWKWPSDRDWFEESALCDSDELKRFHIRSMHEVRQAQNRVTDQKGDHLFVSQDFLVVGAALLALGIAAKMFT